MSLTRCWLELGNHLTKYMRSPFPYFSIFMCVGLLSNRQGIDPKVPRNALARTNGQMVKTMNKLLRALWKSREGQTSIRLHKHKWERVRVINKNCDSDTESDVRWWQQSDDCFSHLSSESDATLTETAGVIWTVVFTHQDPIRSTWTSVGQVWSQPSCLFGFTTSVTVSGDIEFELTGWETPPELLIDQHTLNICCFDWDLPYHRFLV